MQALVQRIVQQGRTDIDAVLNEHDIDALERRGWQWGAGSGDLALLNWYLQVGAERGAWWGQLRAVAVHTTEHSADIDWAV